jgi:hypothetical protein
MNSKSKKGARQTGRRGGGRQPNDRAGAKRRAATAPSKRTRRFARTTLYEIVAEVCRVAAALHGVKLIDVTVVQWTECARQPEIEKKWGRVPAPNEICRQLCNGNDEPATWAEVKRRAFLPPDQLRAVESAQLRQAPERITQHRARWSICQIEQRFGAPCSEREYKASLGRFLRRAARRSKTEAAAIKRSFATGSQILALYDDWNAALVDARVKHPQRASSPEPLRGVSWPQAAALYQLVTGKPPTLDSLRRLAQQGRFSIATRTDHMRHIRAAASVLIRQAKVEPGTVSLEEAAKALGITLEQQRYSRIEVIEAGQRYRQTLTVGEQPTDDGYFAYRQDNPSEPSLQVLKECHGGIRAVVREGERLDRRERATAWDSRRKRERLTRRAATQQARISARKAAEPPQFATESGEVPSERTLSHLLFFEAEESASTGALAARLGVHRVRAQQIVRELRAYGALEPTAQLANSSLQSYRLTTKGRAVVREIKRRNKQQEAA